MSRDRTICASWESFAAKCLPSDIDAATRHHIRIAFYAGATGFYHVLTKNLDGKSRELKESHLQDMLTELQTFTIWEFGAEALH